MQTAISNTQTHLKCDQSAQHIAAQAQRTARTPRRMQHKRSVLHERRAECSTSAAPNAAQAPPRAARTPRVRAKHSTNAPNSAKQCQTASNSAKQCQCQTAQAPNSTIARLQHVHPIAARSPDCSTNAARMQHERRRVRTSARNTPQTHQTAPNSAWKQYQTVQKNSTSTQQHDHPIAARSPDCSTNAQNSTSALRNNNILIYSCITH